jgi:tetratricopeptide (TPR) repeat protein
VRESLPGHRRAVSGRLCAWLSAAFVAGLLCAPATFGSTETGDAEALRNAARLHRERGELEEAKDALREAIELAPHDPSLYQELAIVFQAETQRSETEETRSPRVVEEPPGDQAAAAPARKPARLRIRDERGQIAGWKPRDLALLTGFALLGALILSLLAREIRGKGDLVVCIELPRSQRGTFSVCLSKKPKAKRQARGDQNDPE